MAKLSENGTGCVDCVESLQLTSCAATYWPVIGPDLVAGS